MWLENASFREMMLRLVFRQKCIFTIFQALQILYVIGSIACAIPWIFLQQDVYAATEPFGKASWKFLQKVCVQIDNLNCAAQNEEGVRWQVVDFAMCQHQFLDVWHIGKEVFAKLIAEIIVG